MNVTTPHFRYVVLNIPSSVKRREHMQKICDEQQLEVTFFPAVTPEDMHERASTFLKNYDVEKVARRVGRHLLDQELACALSHILMWQACLDDTESDAWVILEDDIEPQTSLQDLFNEIDFNHIDILKLSGKRKVPYKAIKTLENGYQLCKLAYGSNDLAGMVITKKAAARLLQYSQTLDNAIDEVVDRSFEHGIPIYGVLPWPVDAPVILDTKNPLVSEIGLRPKKNIAGITFKHRVLMRIKRFQDSLKKRKATIQLKLSR